MVEAFGGYDFEFIEDLPEDLTCTLCHYALKNPVQIEVCGHTFCEDCFNQSKDHAAKNSTDFCCPIDRQVIDIARVFKNKADERKVLNLTVKCRYFVDECDWIGELRDVSEHETNCLKNKSVRDKTSEVDMIQLLNRMTELESKLQTNEENVKTNEKKLAEKDQQIENQCKINDEQSTEIKDLKVQMELVSENYDKQIKDLTIQVEKQSTEITNLRTTMMIPDIGDHLNFFAVGTAFQWKFNPVSVKASGVQLYSPPFYNVINSYCFQLGIDYLNNNYRIILFRYRGKYDHAQDMIKTIQSLDFNILVFGKNEKQKVFNFSHSDIDYSIPKFRERNSGLCDKINNNEIDSLTTHGYVHLHCFFKFTA